MEKLKVYTYRFLRFAERYTKTDMIYATKSGFWLMSNQVVGIAVSFVLSVIFAHYLSKEVFGTYRYILSMAAFASAFSLTGINSAVIRAVAQGFGGIFKRSIPVQAFWSIPYFVIALGFSIYYFVNANNIYGFSFLIVSIFAPISGIANTYNAYLNGKKDFRTSAKYGVISSLFYFLLMSVVSLYYPNAITLIAAFYVAGASTNIFFCLRTFKKQKDLLEPTRNEDIRYSKNLSVMNIASTIAQQIDSIAIFHLLGPAQLAIYTFSTIIPDRIRSMFGIIATAAFPKLAENDTNQSRGAILQKVIRLTVLSVFIILFYILVAPFIYKYFFPQYLETVFYSQVFAISLLAIASNISVPALFTQKKEGGLYLVSVGIPVIKIIISVIGIILWGIWGALIAKIFHYIIQTIVSTFIASKPIDN